MFKLRKLLSPKKPKVPKVEGDKQQERDSKTHFQENVNDKGKELSSLQNVENVLSDRKEKSMEKVQTGGSDGEDQAIQERKEESDESISKSKKYHPEDVCDIDTCSKQECTPDTCNRVVDKEALDDNEIDTSKLTEIINSTIKETVKTMIKQCAMDTGRVTSPERKESQEESKILSVCRNKKEFGDVPGDNGDKYTPRIRYYPCEYMKKYEKRPSPIKPIKKCNIKGSYDDSIISKCHPRKECRPCKDKTRGKDTKKHSKTPKNVKTDNRRMTGNVNIYICSEANENAQRKEKEKKEKSESCTESSSETTTERTNSSCVGTSSVSSNKLVSGIQKRRQKLQEVGSNDYFHSRENRVVRCNDEDGVCYEKYEKESCMTLKQDDRLDLSTMSSGSTEIDSGTSSISSTRDGCCCRETISSRFKMHRRDLSGFKPKFLTYDDETASRIFQKTSDHGEIDDRWIPRSVCVDKPQLRCQDSSHRSCRCCCKKKVECKRKSAEERKSSCDVIHKKWSKCSCIVEEDEEDQYVPCPAKSGDVKREDEQDVTICPSFANSKEAKEVPNKNGNTTENLNEQKSTGKFYEDTKEKKHETSKMPMPKISLVLKKSRLNTATGKSKMAIVPKLQPSNRNIKNAAEVSAKRDTKEKIEAKGDKDKNVSQDKSKSFLGRSVKKAMSLVKQEKTQQDKSSKNNVESPQRKTSQTVNQPKMIKPDRNNKMDSEKLSKVDRGAPRISRQEKEIPDSTKITGNEDTVGVEPNKRGKSKLQTILASRRTVQPIKEDSTDLNKSDRPKVAKETENIKEGIGDAEKDLTTERVPSTKITFEESKQEEVVGTNGCVCEKKSFESTTNRCCCCCQPVIECTCEVKKTSTVCVIPKVVVEDVCPLKCNCCRPVDDCECSKPIIYGDCCKSAKVYRYDVPCMECNKPKEMCHCRPTYVDCHSTNCQHRCKETIICVYCDRPRDKCVCRAPIRKCSCCGLSFDVCKCCKIYDGRPIVTDHDGDRKICVTAWKPKPEVKRYFSRNFNDCRSDAIDECYCRKSHKNYGYDDLPYQRSNAFSDVMCELQQKMSDSVCCERCKKSPCCCRRNFDKSSKQRQRSRSPEFCPIRNVPRRTLPLSRVCYSCKASPCRCRKGRTTTMTKKPRAKCYYCKSSPCTCICVREVNKSRSCKCGDSPCRVKEKETVLRGKSFDDSRKKNDEKVSRVRDSDTCVCPLTKPY